MFAAKADRPVEEHLPAWGVFVLESHHTARFRMDRTRSPFLKVIYVLKGRGELKFDSGPKPVSRGSVVVIPLGLPHQICDKPGDPLALLVVCLGRVVLDSLPDAEATFSEDKPAAFSDPYITRETERCLRGLFVEQSLNRPAAPTLMKGMVLQLLAQLSRARGSKAPRFEPPSQARAPEARVHAYVAELQSRFNENEKIDNVVSRLALSRRYFTRLFRKITGDSWLQYVRNLRLNHAKSLLRRGDRTVLAIAFESGFDDASTFYRAFKSVERTTPQLWLAGQKSNSLKTRGRP